MFRDAQRLPALVPVLLSLAFPGALRATTPASGLIDEGHKLLSYSAGPYPIANTSGALSDYTCNQTNPCDNYALTVTLTQAYLDANPYDKLRFRLTPGAPSDDVELQVRAANGTLLDSSRGGPGAREEIILPALAGTTTYTVETMGATPATGATGTIELVKIEPPGPPSGAAGLPPRFQIHASPPGAAEDSGEPSIGFNKHTGHTMFISYTLALRQTYPEFDPGRVDAAGNPLPQSCDATWEGKPGTLTTLNSLDPILFTDEPTGRTFNSQLSGDNSLMEFTDDDGDNWTPAQVGPPNGGADHQTVATGVYPAGFPSPNLTWPATGPKRAVYYCSQSVATAFCSRSDDGGLTFGPGYTFKNPECSAGALHGHVKVAPDGTVYVPDSSQCVLPVGGTAENVIAFRSDNAGETWTVKNVPGSVGGAGSDPSLGIATDGTLYMCYENGDSHVHMAVSHDKGDTWINDQDIGASAGIVATRFPQAIAGDPDRGGCAFLGTTGARPESPSNDPNSLDFEGVWYGYIATTYDGGSSYHLVDVTPNDPVQGWGGICGSGTCRNLLDFNDLQIDDRGRMLFGFADGCIRGCVTDPSGNGFASRGTIVRQTGGRTLFSAFDDLSAGTPVERYNTTTPLKPTAACVRDDLSKRTVVSASVIWNPPDTGGSPVTQYNIYRALDPAGPFSLVGTTTGKTSFVDNSTKPSVEKYYYQVEAINAVGTAPLGNVVELPVTADAIDTCTIPGEIIALDATGDGNADDTDIEYIGVAEPKELADFFVITMKIVNFTTGQPPSGTFYTILFPNFENRYIALDATQGPVELEYGHYTVQPQGLLTFTQDGLLANGSGYTANGTITMVVPRTLFGNLAPGRVIAGFDARTRVGSQTATSRDTAGPSDYVVRGTGICNSTGIAIATLSASVSEGRAPLPVTFTVSGIQTKGKKLQSYALHFGDETGGSPPAFQGTFDDQPSAQTVHAYLGEGVYRARVTVTDETGNTSSNLAEETITVLPADGVAGDVSGDNRLGGAMPPALLALGALGILGRLLRRRPNNRR